MPVFANRQNDNSSTEGRHYPRHSTCPPFPTPRVHASYAHPLCVKGQCGGGAHHIVQLSCSEARCSDGCRGCEACLAPRWPWRLLPERCLQLVSSTTAVPDLSSRRRTPTSAKRGGGANGRCLHSTGSQSTRSMTVKCAPNHPRSPLPGMHHTLAAFQTAVQIAGSPCCPAPPDQPSINIQFQPVFHQHPVSACCV